MHTSSLLLAAISGQTQSAIPPSAPVSPPAQSAAASAATVIPDLSLSWGGYFQALAILCFALAALWILLWFIRRAGNTGIGSSPSMRIESRLALGPKNWLYVVRCRDKRMILGVSEKNISLISESALTEEELATPAKKGLLPAIGKAAFWSGGKKAATGAATTSRRKKDLEDDFPLLQQPEPQAHSAFDEFLQDESGRGPGK